MMITMKATRRLVGSMYRVAIQLNDSGFVGDWVVKEFFSLGEAKAYAHEMESFYKYAWSITIYLVETHETAVDW